MDANISLFSSKFQSLICSVYCDTNFHAIVITSTTIPIGYIDGFSRSCFNVVFEMIL